MKGITALCGALLLTLVLVAPAAADQKVYVEQRSGPFQFEGPVEWFGFECTGPLFLGYYGHADLWLWYPNGVEEDEMFPEDRAWPWVRGFAKGEGTFYFSTEEGMGGTVLSGPQTYDTHMYDHHLGTPTDLANDPESWTEKATGLAQNINVPGHGTVVHQAGTTSYKVLVTEYHEYPEDDVYGDGDELRPWRGNWTFDVEELCAYFGYEVAP
jgi:hypothetical protein